MGLKQVSFVEKASYLRGSLNTLATHARRDTGSFYV